MNDLWGFPQHFDHPSNPTSAFAETAAVAAADSLVCLTGLTIAEWNNLKKICTHSIMYRDYR